MLIVNLDTHRPLVLLPGRDQRTLATWFRKYPEIQVVSRDRSGVYATAAREGAPQARQVADRWHLLKNIGDEPERMMYRYMPLIRLVVRELSLKKSPEPEISVPVASLRRLERLKQHIRKNGISVGQRLWPCITRDVVSGKYPVLQACRE
ncbi:putative transposase [Escherichia coli H591]|nr:putative transposase [Escherichia coli H591]